SGDLYLIPERLHMLALIKIDLGKYEEADQLFIEASDYADSMLANSPNSRVKAALVIAMSSIYSDHASLLLGHFKDQARTYTVVESARGRTLTDLLRSGLAGMGGDEDPNLEKEFSALRLKIASSRSATEIRSIRNDLFIRELGRWLPQGVAQPLV